MSVSELEAAVKELSPEELVHFNAWYQEFVEQTWDKRIATDAAAGKLEFLQHEAAAERQAGTLRRFP
jgi:cystathionine beta-lyase family protein involved in aluminum resistance